MTRFSSHNNRSYRVPNDLKVKDKIMTDCGCKPGMCILQGRRLKRGWGSCPPQTCYSHKLNIVEYIWPSQSRSACSPQEVVLSKTTFSTVGEDLSHKMK